MLSNELLFSLIAACGMFVQSTVGFAGALLAVPLFSLYWEPRDVVPVFTIIILLNAFVMVINARKFVLWQTLLLLLCGGIPASFFGVWALVALSATQIRLIMNITIMMFAIIFLCNFQMRVPASRWIKVVVGAIGGFLGGSISASGPPVVVYGLTQDWTKEKFRATVLSYYLFIGLFSAMFSAKKGLIGSHNLPLLGTAIIPVALASWAGMLLKGRLSEQTFRRAVLLIILVLAAFGLCTSIF